MVSQPVILTTDIHPRNSSWWLTLHPRVIMMMMRATTTFHLHFQQINLRLSILELCLSLCLFLSLLFAGWHYYHMDFSLCFSGDGTDDVVDVVDDDDGFHKIIDRHFPVTILLQPLHITLGFLHYILTHSAVWLNIFVGGHFHRPTLLCLVHFSPSGTGFGFWITNNFLQNFLSSLSLSLYNLLLHFLPPTSTWISTKIFEFWQQEPFHRPFPLQQQKKNNRKLVRNQKNTIFSSQYYLLVYICLQQEYWWAFDAQKNFVFQRRQTQTHAHVCAMMMFCKLLVSQ